MAQLALAMVQSGQNMSVAAVARAYKQPTLKFCQSYTLNADPDDLDSQDQEIVLKLHSLVKKEKLQKARVSFGLVSEDVMLNLIEMPPVSQEDVRQILEFELDSHLPVDPKNVTFDARILDLRSGLNSHVVLVAAAKSHLHRYQSISDKVDLSLDVISPAVLTVTNTVQKIWKPITESEINVFLIANESDYEIVIAKNGKYIAGRKVKSENPWAVNGNSADSDTRNEILDVPSGIQQSIQLALIMCNQSSSLKNIEEIICLGQVDKVILDELKERMPATIFSMFQVDHLIPEKATFSEIAAICLAIDLLEDDDFINLVPPELRPVRRDFGRVLIGAAAGLLVSAMVLVGANNYWQTDLNYLATEAQISALQSKVEQITEINNRFASSQDARGFFMAKSAAYPSQLEILREVTLLLPSDESEEVMKVWLENYEVEDNELTIRGDSDSPEGLITLLEESPLFEKVKFDGTVSGTRFTIKANISKLTDSDELVDHDTYDEESSTKAIGTATPKPTPTIAEPSASESNSDEEAEGDDSNQEIGSRGPAFPRTKHIEPMDQSTDESESDSESESESEDEDHTKALSPEEQAELDSSVQQEDMEKMKKNLFDFIQERKESGELDTSESKEYQEQDPDEAAANFLEFLKAAADGNGGDN